MIRTVTGDVHTLGHCQLHEHLIVRPGPATARHPALLLDDEPKSLAELATYARAGGAALLDAQPGGAGRDAAALHRLSTQTGVRIICVTGYHLPFFYDPTHFIFTAPEQALYEHFLAELQKGTPEAPTVRAGAVKAAIGTDAPTGHTAARLRAAARAAADANVPLLLHTERGLHALAAIALCEQMGLPPHRVLICHADRQAHDYAPHEAVARTGAWLEYDTIARPKYHDDDSERRLILHMLDKGYENQLLLSLDTTAERLSSYGGSPGLTYILNEFIPSLERMGVPRATLDQITTANPTRVFSRTTALPATGKAASHERRVD